MRLETIVLGVIEANPHQPRRELRKIDELAASIAEIGVTQPVIVVWDNGYRLVDGHRRAAAAKQAGLTEIPALIADTDTEALEVMRLYASNTQRDDFDAVEQSRVVQDLLEMGVEASAIEKASGLTELEVGYAKTVAAAPAKVAEKVTAIQASLEEAAALVEFAGTEFEARITNAVGDPRFEHTVTYARQEKARQDKRERGYAKLEKEGVRLLTEHTYIDYNAGVPLDELSIVVKNHASCPGHGGYVDYEGHVKYVCTDAAKLHGYTGGRKMTAEPVKDKAFERRKRERRAGWKAATVVRLEFAKVLCGDAKRSAEALRWVAKEACKSGLPGVNMYGITGAIITTIMPRDAQAPQQLLALAIGQSEKAIAETVKFGGMIKGPHEHGFGKAVASHVDYLKMLVRAGYTLSDAETATLEEAKAAPEPKIEPSTPLGPEAVAEIASEDPDDFHDEDPSEPDPGVTCPDCKGDGRPLCKDGFSHNGNAGPCKTCGGTGVLASWPPYVETTDQPVTIADGAVVTSHIENGTQVVDNVERPTVDLDTPRISEEWALEAKFFVKDLENNRTSSFHWGGVEVYRVWFGDDGHEGEISPVHAAVDSRRDLAAAQDDLNALELDGVWVVGECGPVHCMFDLEPAE